MRQLVTVQTVKLLEKIEGKDRILYASFENTGWKVIVSSSTKVGDKVVFVEADSILPIHPEFEFLRPRCFSPSWNGFVIKNMKMAGLYSTGIAFPLSLVESIDLDKLPNKATKPPQLKVCDLKDGDELTEYFCVRKYDTEEQPTKVYVEPKKKHPLVKLFWSIVYRNKYLTMVVNFLLRLLKPKDKYVWPEFMSHTDETRAQVVPYVYSKYQDQLFYATEKLDGSSCTFGYCKKKFYVCSRNLRLKYNPKATKDYWWNYAIENDLEKRFKRISKELKIDLYVQGELIGQSIQGNKYKLNNRDFYIFNIKDVTNNTYYSDDQISIFCRTYGFNMVPGLGSFKFSFKNIDDLLIFSKGFSKLNPTTIREGVVIRPCVPQPADRGQSNMCSFKVINPDFDCQ